MIMTREAISLKMFFKFLLVGFIALQVCTYASCASDTTSLVHGIPILPIRNLAAGNISKSNIQKDTCDAGKLFDCKTCSTRLICDAKGDVLATRDCGGTTPYCSGGNCVEELPESCPAPVSPLCPIANQIYPSPASCQRYIKCDANRKATEYLCPGNLVYAPPYYLCSRPYNSRDCPVINCTNNSGKFIVYPRQTDIYFYCGAQGDTKILQCPEGNEFNAIELRCEPKCERPGLLAATNKREYYVCAYSNEGGFDKFLMSCPGDAKFEASTGSCT